MRKLGVLVVLATTVTLGSCQQATEPTEPWFSGGFDAALAEAGTRESLVLMEFYSDT